MSERSEKESLFKGLTSADLKEICKQNGLTGFSGLKHGELAKFLAKNLELSPEEVRSLVQKYQTDKLLRKVRDSADYFLSKQVQIKCKDEELVKASVGSHSVTINNLGKPDFSYMCDDKCYDYQYQVKTGRFPYCKHFPAVVAELVLSQAIDLHKVKITGIQGVVLDELLKIVEGRAKAEGMIFKGRDIEDSLRRLNADFLKIANQDIRIAREKYHDVPENVFENLANEAFLLLEFDTVPRTSPHGWDMILIAGRALHPYFIVVECKTAAEGIYDYLVKKADYLFRLKTYCIDLFRDKLHGAYKGYAKYMILVAPGFPQEIEECCRKFKEITGFQLSFFPASVLLGMVNKYRKSPILNHDWIEPLFQKEKVIDERDIDEIFDEAERQIDVLSNRLCKKLRERFDQFSQISGDAAFIKLDMNVVSSVLEDIISEMPELVIPERKGILDYINIEHDYFEIWERILRKLGREFIDILRKTSFSQVKSTELKEDLLRQLSMK